jgi:hypothetical protein
MPLTFPSHAGVVLPLKVWRPRWFDGVALVVGSAAPDLAYALDGSWLEHPVKSQPPLWSVAHSWPGLLIWCLPVTLALTLLARWLAPVTASYLPGPLRDYGAIGANRPFWLVTIASALLGAASHLIWDRLATGSLDLISTLAGALVTTFVLIHAARAGLIRAWHGPPPLIPRRPILFWVPAGVIIIVLVPLSGLLPSARLLHTSFSRVLLVLVIAIFIGSALSGRRKCRT